MGFRHFRGPEDDMGLLPYIRTCSLCGQPGRCFALDHVISSEMSEQERQGKVGCIDCLRRDRFGFVHDTDVGMITEDGLLTFGELDDKPKRVFVVGDDGQTIADIVPLVSPPQPHVPKEAIAELRRTPSFSSWQEISWPVHCNDFMAYSEHTEQPSAVVFECLYCGAKTEIDDPD
jgi:hypothetical protein